MFRSIFLFVLVLGGTLFGVAVSASAQSLERAMATYYRGDYADAIKALTPFAEEGDTHAQYLIGYMHERGQGIPQDYAEAANWYAKAAELGHPFAQNNLGVLYKHGRGVEKDPVAAYKWFGLAAEGYQAAEFGHRERALSNQETVAVQMTGEQLTAAKKQIKDHRASEPGWPEYRPPNVR
jgi:TPR repeat protein